MGKNDLQGQYKDQQKEKEERDREGWGRMRQIGCNMQVCKYASTEEQGINIQHIAYIIADI